MLKLAHKKANLTQHRYNNSLGYDIIKEKAMRLVKMHVWGCHRNGMQ
jgi:hypothetical protein